MQVTHVKEFFERLAQTDFEKTHLRKAPFALADSALAMRKRIGWPLLLEIFEAQHRDCWLANGGQLHSEICHGFLDWDSSQAGFASGYTIVIRHGELAHTELKLIATEFDARYGKPVDLQIYATPKGEQGFGWHYDLEDVFVFQSSGMKEFRLRQNLNHNPPPFSPTQKADMSEIQMACVLKAGDFLYIPSGWWHQARALTPSFHLSVGVSFHR